MAAHILPQDVAEHLEAAIQLSNRRVHLRFLEEAEALLALNLPTAAVLVAGMVVESILAGPRDQVVQERQRMERWSELRNGVAHALGPAVSSEQAREIGDVRRALMQESRVGPRLPSSTAPAGAPRQVRGKYKFVPTSSTEFISRKSDELRLEHDERGN
jgi:hypothetical protein